MSWFIFVALYLLTNLSFASIFFYFHSTEKLPWSFKHGNCHWEQANIFNLGFKIFSLRWKTPYNINFFNSLSRVEVLNKDWKYPYNHTAWKLSAFVFFLVCIFPHSDWIRRDTFSRICPYSVRMRENTDKKTPNTDTFHALSAH